MGFWFLDDKSQLALLMAGLVGAVGVAGCDDSKPAKPDTRRDQSVFDPPPSDFRARDVMIVDPAPRDLRTERRPADMKKRDAMVVDMAPRDQRVDSPVVVDMAPWDASASRSPTPMPKASAPKLPLARDFRAKIASRRLAGNMLELKASITGANVSGLTYRWKVSGGTLDESTAAVVRWTPPSTRGSHLAQVTVRDGNRAMAVEVFLHTIK